MALHEDGCRFLIDAGFSPDEAWLAIRLVAEFVEGFAARARYRASGPVGVQGLDDVAFPEDYPSLMRARRTLGTSDSDHYFSFGLDCILRGLPCGR